jgi:hypothetical protein
VICKAAGYETRREIFAPRIPQKSHRTKSPRLDAGGWVALDPAR